MQDELEASGWRRWPSNGLFKMIGPIWCKPSVNGGSHFGMVTDERHTNGMGLVHGGVVCSFADNALSIAAYRAVKPDICVTLQLNVHFLLAIKPGSFLRTEASIESRGQSIYFLSGELFVGDRRVATAAGLWRRIAQRNSLHLRTLEDVDVSG